MISKPSARKNFTIGANQFRVSRTDHLNQKCQAFFRWFKTDAQEIRLAERIAQKMLALPEYFGQEIRVDFELKEEGTYALFIVFTRKADTFFDLKLTNFIKVSKITNETCAMKIVLNDYTFAYKLIPTDSSHFYGNMNMEGFRYKLYFSSHLIFKKEHFFKKHNLQRLASEVIRYVETHNLVKDLEDGTPIIVKAMPSRETDAIRHTLSVTCSLWYDKNSNDDIKYQFIVDGVRYLSMLRRNYGNDDNFYIEEPFELMPAKVVEPKAKPTGLTIIKKKA